MREGVAEAVNAVDGDIVTEVISELPMQGISQEIEEVCPDDGIINKEDHIQRPPPHYQDLIIEYMDIAEPLSTLKHLLEVRLQCSLTNHQFYLQDSIELDGDKSLVDQCVQGEGEVQFHLEIKSQPGVQPKINILDVLKNAEDETQEKYIAEHNIESDRFQSSRVMPLSDETVNVARWVVDQGFRRDQERLNIPFDPSHWSELHVKHWLLWAVKVFCLQGVDVGAFNLDGEQLCMMSHPEFMQHIPHDPGDLFWKHLELLQKCKFVAVMQQPTNAGTQSDMGRRYAAGHSLESDHSQSSRVMPLSDEIEYVTRWVVDQGFRREQERLKIPFDPSHWSELHVKHWLRWAVKEFSLQRVDVDAFNFDGEDLCNLLHTEVLEYIPNDPGDLFWKHLELLRKCKFVAVKQQSANAGTTSDMDRSYEHEIALDHSQSSTELPLSDEFDYMPRWVFDQDFHQDQERLNIPFDPFQWSELHVKHWLHWAVEEFSLQGVDVSAFNFDGEQLCTMSYPVFVQHIPHDPGDVFWTHLELLRKCKYVAVPQQLVSPGTMITTSSDMDGSCSVEE